jgi:hypothetical protein
MALMAHEMKSMPGLTPEQIAAAQARVIAAKRALRKVNKLRAAATSRVR